ncbi:hypothetical protein C8E95_6841 [Pseudonocardia autotrophica]|uniref:Uncharacterized protein n=2 Tax=Pseudonocardia TaxID=1847 RepID=A0A1Y2MLJ0_PSEAH|nr:hypothetical protein BG845_05625 [Pseudonocardia autotrophica]TDN77592.1 hypothetical protein C8E95_6841 [Pseudonocardia autotrophica]BBG01622.1 hypothetical protein Pdca_28310 [Pseudonocardia autotrophica]GEC25367.1 hypothetical protein PSA01_23960 [Pseudonocardia saturnea]
MPTPPPPPDPTAALAGWIHRLTCLRDDIGFGLDARGVAATLSDVVDDMQQARKGNP